MTLFCNHGFTFGATFEINKTKRKILLRNWFIYFFFLYKTNQFNFTFILQETILIKTIRWNLKISHLVLFCPCLWIIESPIIKIYWLAAEQCFISRPPLRCDNCFGWKFDAVLFCTTQDECRMNWVQDNQNIQLTHFSPSSQ